MDNYETTDGNVNIINQRNSKLEKSLSIAKTQNDAPEARPKRWRKNANFAIWLQYFNPHVFSIYSLFLEIIKTYFSVTRLSLTKYPVLY